MKPAKNVLTPEEATRLAELEPIAYSRYGRTGLEKVKTRLRLAIETKFYKPQFRSFSAYCKSIGISVGHAYRITNGRPERKKHGIKESLRWEIWERDNFTCAYCRSRRYLAVDHVIAESKGGTTTPDNLVTACRKCNGLKGAGTVEHFQFNRVFRMFSREILPILKSHQ